RGTPAPDRRRAVPAPEARSVPHRRRVLSRTGGAFCPAPEARSVPHRRRVLSRTGGRADPSWKFLAISFRDYEPPAPAVRNPVRPRAASWARDSRHRETHYRGARMIPMTQFRLKPARGSRRVLAVATIVSAGALAAGALAAAPAGASAHTGGYRQINLVSDQPGNTPLRHPHPV